MSGHNSVTRRIVLMIFRWLLVAILCGFIVLFSIDYLLIHGDLVLNKIGAAPMVHVLDEIVGPVIWGPDAYYNRLFFATISIGILVALIGIVYKFWKK